MELMELKNIGSATIEWLHEVGIHTVEDLQQIGAITAYMRLKQAFPKAVSLNALYGLEGALTNSDWRMISHERKAELKQAVQIALKNSSTK